MRRRHCCLTSILLWLKLSLFQHNSHTLGVDDFKHSAHNIHLPSVCDNISALPCPAGLVCDWHAVNTQPHKTHSFSVKNYENIRRRLLKQQHQRKKATAFQLSTDAKALGGGLWFIWWRIAKRFDLADNGTTTQPTRYSNELRWFVFQIFKWK